MYARARGMQKQFEIISNICDKKHKKWGGDLKSMFLFLHISKINIKEG